jgi:hypothetical protein
MALSRLTALFGSDALFPMQFDDGKVIVRLAPTKLTPLLLAEVPDIVRLPSRFSTVPLSKEQMAALPTATRRKIRQKAFMCDLYFALSEEFLGLNSGQHDRPGADDGLT